MIYFDESVEISTILSSITWQIENHYDSFFDYDLRLTLVKYWSRSSQTAFIVSASLAGVGKWRRKLTFFDNDRYDRITAGIAERLQQSIDKEHYCSFISSRLNAFPGWT